MNRIDQIPIKLYRLMIIIFVAILGLTTFVSNYNSASVLVYAVFFYLVIKKIVEKNENIFDCSSDIRNILVLSITCFITKFLWICFMRMEPQADYATFYYSAVNLSKSWIYTDRYIALFPHIMGYSTFLSIWFKLFGESVFLATLLNVFLTVISGILIYKIVRNIISSTAAILSYVLWIICPSQTIYNSLVLSEPLYTTLILGFIYFVTVISKKENTLNWINMLPYGAFAGIILCSINVNRPIAMVLVISVLIWIFVLRFKELFNKHFLRKWLSFIIVMLTVYFSLGSLWNLYFTSRIGEEPASAPGYNIYVGFNASSQGTWNEEDSALLFSYSNAKNATAVQAQEQMLNEAKKRILSNEIDFSYLFKSKLSWFLGKDSVCVDYCSDIINETEYFSMICNVFYYCMILLSILSGYKMFKTSHRSSVFILPLYVIGITFAQLLVEVAPRYHYSVVPFLIIISQFYLFRGNTCNTGDCNTGDGSKPLKKSSKT